MVANRKWNNSVPFPFQGTSGRTVRVTSILRERGKPCVKAEKAVARSRISGVSIIPRAPGPGAVTDAK